MVTTAGQKVQMFMAVVALQAFRHSLTVKGESGLGSRKGSQKPRLFAFGNSHPLQRAQRMGHPSTQRMGHSSTRRSFWAEEVPGFAIGVVETGAAVVAA